MAVEAKPVRSRLHELATRPQEVFQQAFDQRQRVRGMPVLAHEHAADILARQGRFELAQFIGVEFVDLDAVFTPQIPGEAILSQASFGAIDKKMAQPMHEILGAGGGDKRPQRFEGRADERAQSASLRADLLWSAGPDEAEEPRSDRRQIAPAERQRTERVEEPARHLPDHARHRQRCHRRAVEAAGIAKGGASTRLSGFDQKDGMAVALKPARRADPDHAGSDHPDPPYPIHRHPAYLPPPGPKAILGSSAAKREPGPRRFRKTPCIWGPFAHLTAPTQIARA